MTKTKTILLILLAVFLIPIFFHYECPVKLLFHIACPGCGLTRAIKEILHFNVINSFNYNMLGLPIFIFIIISIILLVRDIIKKQDKYYDSIIKFISKHYIIIIILLITNMIINNIKHI